MGHETNLIKRKLSVRQTSIPKQKKGIHNHIADARGYTLAEMVVSFALTGIFMVTAAAVLPAFIGNYARVRSVASAQNVADILLEKIVSELEGASREEFALSGDSQLSFYNEHDIRVTIGLLGDLAGPSALAEIEKKELYPAMLAMRYEAVQIDLDGNMSVDETDWYFGKGIYQGNEVKELLFMWKGANLMKVELTLVNTRTGYECAAGTMVECLNLEKIRIIKRGG